MGYIIAITKQAQKDAQKLESCGLDKKANPYQTPQKLIGDLKGFYSRRINIKHRIIYKVYEKENTIKILRMWTHYQ